MLATTALKLQPYNQELMNSCYNLALLIVINQKLSHPLKRGHVAEELS